MDRVMAAGAPILPGTTIGILGSGQLGRMLAQAAHDLGYRVHIYSPERETPAGQVSDWETSAPYEDLDAVRAFARQVDVVTYEFENVPAVTAAVCAEEKPVRPGVAVLATAQNRQREKHALAAAGLPVAPFHPVATWEDLTEGLGRVGYPAILKSATAGYDGKGQWRLTSEADVPQAWRALAGRPAIVEAVVPFVAELSVVAARGVNGAQAHFDVIHTEHRNHILDIAGAPADISPTVRTQALALASAILEHLAVVGVLCVELFLTADEQLLVNEIAPRPHNSGHLTLDACSTDQFEQQLRAVCGLPLGATDYRTPAVMANLLGELWQRGEPNWAAAWAIPGVKWRLYGKREPRPGRKMGHLTALGADMAQARALALRARDALHPPIAGR